MPTKQRRCQWGRLQLELKGACSGWFHVGLEARAGVAGVAGVAGRAGLQLKGALSPAWSGLVLPSSTRLLSAHGTGFCAHNIAEFVEDCVPARSPVT